MVPRDAPVDTVFGGISTVVCLERALELGRHGLVWVW